MTVRWIRLCVLLPFALVLSGCVTTQGGKSSAQIAHEQADQAMYKPVEYCNAATPGCDIVVLPGDIKSANATFTQKISSNNIADYAEIELDKANFQVLERSNLGSMLEEIQLAVGLGDPAALKKFKRGKFKSTRWFVKFDILKAEPVAAVEQRVSGQALGNVLSALAGSSASGQALAQGVASVESQDATGIWIVGLRYKIMDARTCEQKASGYFEEKMEIGSKGSSFMGISQSQTNTTTLDTMTQRLVQLAVAEIDQQYK